MKMAQWFPVWLWGVIDDKTKCHLRLPFSQLTTIPPPPPIPQKTASFSLIFSLTHSLPHLCLSNPKNPSLASLTTALYFSERERKQIKTVIIMTDEEKDDVLLQKNSYCYYFMFFFFKCTLVLHMFYYSICLLK